MYKNFDKLNKILLIIKFTCSICYDHKLKRDKKIFEVNKS